MAEMRPRHDGAGTSIAHPRLAAAALRYREGMRAPVLVAKGRGRMAEEIVRRAREAGVFVHESSELVGMLMQLDLDERIPPELYRAVAEILVWAYRLDRGLPAGPPGGSLLATLARAPALLPAPKPER